MTIKKLINGITSVLLILILLSTATIVISSKVSGGTPKIMGNEILTVLSGSMEPTIMTGSIIAVKPVTDTKSLKVGDVITFKSLDDPNILITHRIMEIKQEGGKVSYITKGDNNDAADTEPIPAENVKNVYADFTIPYLGYLISFMKTKAGIAIMMIVPGVYLIVSQMISLWKAIGNAEKEKLAQAEQQPTEKLV